MTPWKRTLVAGVVEICCLLFAYKILLWYVSGHNVVAAILSAGPHISHSALALAGTFLLLRLLVILALPGMILSRIGLALLDLFRR